MDSSIHPFIHSSLFREYDIRGIVGETLYVEDARAIGRAYATLMQRSLGRVGTVAVAWDGRLSSPMLVETLVDGLMQGGAQVLRVGLGPTPMLYFATKHLTLDGGIMVTGSHNPPSHNGFKMVMDGKALFGAEIQALGKIAQSGAFVDGVGAVHDESVMQDYVLTLMAAYPKNGRMLKVAWDAGNGAAGAVMAEIASRLPGIHTTLFAEIDGNFPNHHPDPSEEKNLQDVMRTVREKKCDIGTAFDGDGDRIGVVDDEGRMLFGDELLAVYAAALLKEQPGAMVIADVKASKGLFDVIAELGGKPVMWKTGHSLIKAKMAETGAPLAGEMSGHMFFADTYYGYDDGLYAAIRILAILAVSDKKLSELRKIFPASVSTPELRIVCEESRKFQIIEEVKARLLAVGAEFSDIDGVRVTTKDGWWLLRASNTQAVLVGRCEAADEKALDTLKAALAAQLAASGVR